MKSNPAVTSDVRRHVREAIDWYADALYDDMIATYEWVDDPCSLSPIEIIFSAWWYVYAKTDLGPWKLSLRSQQNLVLNARKYRLDFVVYPPESDVRAILKRGRAFPKIAVELDGHDFHEKTKAQVAARNRRDRDLQADGWKVLHFSGSEVVRDPLKCVEAVYALAEADFTRAWIDATAVNDEDWTRPATPEVTETSAQ